MNVITWKVLYSTISSGTFERKSPQGFSNYKPACLCLGLFNLVYVSIGLVSSG